MEKGEHSSGGDEMEWEKVSLMRVFVERQDPAAKVLLLLRKSKEFDNFALRRFLRARDMDIEKASTMFLKYLKWRKEVVPAGFISDAEIKNELVQKKMFLQGNDKKGCPIGVAFGSKHYSSKRDMDEFKRFIVFSLEKMCSRMPRGQEKFVGIADLKGWGYSNCDIRAYLAALEIMQNYYPERLSKIFLIHVPYLFMKAWKAIYPFIDNNTKKKFVFVEDKHLKSTLLADIDENQLLDIYGGNLKLVPIDE